MLATQHQKFKEEVQHFRTEIFGSVRTTREDLSEQISNSDKFFGEMTTVLNNDIREVRTLATDAMKRQEKEIVDKFSDQFDQVKSFMEENIDEIKLQT